MVISREVLAGMLGIPQATPSQDEIYVELLAPAKVIRVFLSMIALPRSLRVLPQDPGRYATLQDCLDIFDFGTMCEIGGLKEALARPFRLLEYGEIPELFAAASIRSNLELARIAVMELTLIHFTPDMLGKFEASVDVQDSL